MDQVSPAAEVLSFPNAPRTDERLLETVLNNMSQGVLLFDAEMRLIFCNQRYCEMYGLVPEFARPGRFLRDLLVQRIQSGTLAEDPDEYIVRLKEGIAAGSSFTNTVHLSDGRAYCVVNKALEGGGWVATHEDITERQRSEIRIAHMARHDALTDLPNRMLLRERLEHELKRVKRGECLAVLCPDLDRPELGLVQAVLRPPHVHRSRADVDTGPRRAGATHQPRGRDTRPVAGHLGVRAVRVQDPDRDVVAVHGEHLDDAVRADRVGDGRRPLTDEIDVPVCVPARRSQRRSPPAAGRPRR